MKTSLFFAAVLLLGAGCTFNPAELFEQPPEASVVDATTDALVFQGGEELVLTETLVGLSPEAFAETNGEGVRVVTVDSYTPGVRARVSYNVEEESVRLTTLGLAEGESLVLPAFWPAFDQTFEDESLLWLSDQQFQELKESGETALRPGFRSQLFLLLDTREQVDAWFARLTGEVGDSQGPKIFQARIRGRDARPYKLTIDEETRWVRTMEVENWFGQFTILDHPDNPLVLKATLNPLSIATVSSISDVEIADGLTGYQVDEIQTVD